MRSDAKIPQILNVLSMQVDADSLDMDVSMSHIEYLPQCGASGSR